MSQFQSISGKELVEHAGLVGENFFHAFPRRMALLTAGTPQSYNTMTIGWGLVGYSWNRPLVEVHVRPARYTHDFVEREELFTVSFFDGGWADALMLCGSKSGRDIDKAAETGLTPMPIGGSVAFAQAESVYLCRKIYQTELSNGVFLDRSVEQQNYPGKDYHTVYYGELVELLKRT